MTRKHSMRRTFCSTFYSPSKSTFVVISMVSLFLLCTISALSFFTLSFASHHHHHHPYKSPHFTASPPKAPEPSTISIRPEIQRACTATRFLDRCESSLSESSATATNANVIEIIRYATRVSLENLKTAQSMVEDILEASVGNLNRTTAARICLEVLRNSNYRISSTIDLLPRSRIKDCRAWMSAALLYQYDCWSALKYANDTQMVDKTMSFFTSLIELSSNALSMMAAYDVFGNQTGSWGPPKTEREGFWEGVGPGSNNPPSLTFTGGFPSELTADATVCTDGSGGCYTTVQEAVNVAPDNEAARKFVIHIKEGIYEEMVRVPLEKKNLVFLGDGMGKTVITGSLKSGQPGITTYNSATVGVSGDGFMARGLTIQNTAGPDAHQAVAFRSDSDLSVIENVEFLGNQDTLYAHSLRQFYKSCQIQGNVDFIFGNSASFFQDCSILIRPRQINPEKGENNAITAHGRTDPAQSTCFVFQNCMINGTEDYMKLYYNKPKVHKNFLGRPWKEYSRTVFLRCNLEALVAPQGWMPWSGDFALETLFYGEFENFGPGSNISDRVPWSNQISTDHVSAYSIENFIQGNEWISQSQMDRHRGMVKRNQKPRIQ